MSVLLCAWLLWPSSSTVLTSKLAAFLYRSHSSWELCSTSATSIVTFLQATREPRWRSRASSMPQRPTASTTLNKDHPEINDSSQFISNMHYSWPWGFIIGPYKLLDRAHRRAANSSSWKHYYGMSSGSYLFQFSCLCKQQTQRLFRVLWLNCGDTDMSGHERRFTLKQKLLDHILVNWLYYFLFRFRHF